MQCKTGSINHCFREFYSLLEVMVNNSNIMHCINPKDQHLNPIQDKSVINLEFVTMNTKLLIELLFQF
jgi:hypothetical protein